MIKTTFKNLTKIIKYTASSTINGIDEGINGDNIKQKREEKKAIEEKNFNDYVSEKNWNKKIFLVAFIMSIIVLIGLNINCSFDTECIITNIKNKLFLLFSPYLLAILIVNVHKFLK